MGSMIHLAVGRLEIDWGKNNGFRDHSALFQKTDLNKVPYWYVSDDAEPKSKDEFDDYIFDQFSEQKDGLSKLLVEVADRVRMLGHTLVVAEQDFSYCANLNGFETAQFSFDDLKTALSLVDVSSVSPDYGEGGEDFGKFFRRHIVPRLGLEAKLDDPFQMHRICEAMENLSPETIILLLSENPKARDLPVVLAFSDVEEGGYEGRDSFVKDLEKTNTFLLVTEGTSDANIIKHAFSLLMPHIADFFSFVDVTEGYPFAGTGSQFNFAKGLIAIAVQNRIVFIYDNDAEGSASLARTEKLNLPDNIKAIKLPDLAAFEGFASLGPSGHYNADINGRAAAIECYLDLGPEALIRWTSFNRDLGEYQGELIDKTKWSKRFYRISSKDDGYDLSKISRVLADIVQTCITMREKEKLAFYEREARLMSQV